MYTFDLSNTLHQELQLQSPHGGFDITKYISFATGNTRPATHHKLNQTRSSDNITNKFLFQQTVDRK